MSTIGFVGLGNMGGPMAANLAKAGHEVRVFDLVPELISGVAGATGAESAADAASDVDVFISMLPAGRHVEGLYLGDNGVAEHLRGDALVIDCSTIDPGTSRKVAGALADRGITMLDAPPANMSVDCCRGGPCSDWDDKASFCSFFVNTLRRSAA